MTFNGSKFKNDNAATDFISKNFFDTIVYLIIITIIFFSPPFCRAQKSSNLIVHFETNGRDLNSADKKQLERVFEEVKLGPEIKILVVGYTDSTGKTNANYTLSRMRANTVKNFLIALLKVDTDKIVAVGRGPESPVAGNDTVKNRALNRRAEIFTLGQPGSVITILKSERSPVLPPPPDPKNYMDMLNRAQKLVRIGAWEEALVLLKKAKAQGAEHHSLWHLLNGIIGYHQGASPIILISYLERSLELDATNLDAIDYWGRAKARKYVEMGIIMADMGRSANSAIKVDTLSQQYELMKLFKVEPLKHTRLPGQAIDVWQCRTPNMTTINYFFDVSSVYQWAYSPISQKIENN